MEFQIFKNKTGLLLLLMFVFSCKKHIENEAKITAKTTYSLEYADEKTTLVSAHRGGADIMNYPENCLETIDYLNQKGIKIFEIDLAVTKDQQLILMHDNSLQKTTTGRQDVDQVSLEKIKSYYLKDDFGNVTNFKVPTFEEALDWLQNNQAYFMVDFKKGVSYEKVIEMIRNKNLSDKCVLISYTQKQANALHKLGSEFKLSMNLRNDRELEALFDSNIPTNQVLAFTGTILSDKKFYEKLHQNKILVILGTLGNLDKKAKSRGNRDYLTYKALGVDIFATDRPLEVYKTLQQND